MNHFPVKVSMLFQETVLTQTLGNISARRYREHLLFFYPLVT